MIELKLCPFCGSEDVGTVLPYAVYCFGCGANGPQTSTEAGAIEKWNERKELNDAVGAFAAVLARALDID